MISIACEGDFADRGCRFSIPLNILGGGSFRWAGTPSLDRSMRDRIVSVELIGDQIADRIDDAKRRAA